MNIKLNDPVMTNDLGAGYVAKILEEDNYYIVLSIGGAGWYLVSSLSPVTPSWSDLTVGMLIEDTNGAKAKVLGVWGVLFTKSSWDNFEKASGITRTKTEAQELGWKVVGAEEEKYTVGQTVTLSEEEVIKLNG